MSLHAKRYLVMLLQISKPFATNVLLHVKLPKLLGSSTAKLNLETAFRMPYYGAWKLQNQNLIECRDLDFQCLSTFMCWENCQNLPTCIGATVKQLQNLLQNA